MSKISLKKLFGGINLTWRKLIVFAVVAGAYTALMALLPNNVIIGNNYSVLKRRIGRL